MKIWVDPAKAWKLSRDYYSRGMKAKQIATLLYEKHGLVSMRGESPYSENAVHVMLKKKKAPKITKRLVRKDMPAPVAASSTSAETSIGVRLVPAPQASDNDHLLDAAQTILGLGIDAGIKIDLLKRCSRNLEKSICPSFP